MSGSGITLSVNSATASQVTLHYAIASDASTGSQNLTLSTRFGMSNAAAFQVGDPTPVVTGVAPNVWTAGTTTAITITGSSFGTNPSLTVTGPGVSGWTIASASDTQIVANVTVAANSPGGSGNVQVQSNGYLGNGFAPANPGQSADSALESILIQSIPAPPPQIIFQGMNVSATTQNVVVGQQIALTIGPPPTGLTINNRSWSGVNAGEAIGGWVPGQQPQIPNPNNESFGFYWVNLGTSGQASYTVTYSWTLDNGQSNSASVAFTVSGPANPTVTSTVGAVQIQPIRNQKITPKGTPNLLLNGVSVSAGQVGIKFLATAALPSGNTGAYSWVQLVNHDSINLVLPDGYPNSSAGTHTCTSFSSPSPKPELDNVYPYGSPGANLFTQSVAYDVATDGPAIGPRDGYSFGEMSRSFTATMYLLWTPSPGPNCSGAACSVPVPLGTISWSMTGDAINTLSPAQGLNGTTYVLTGCQTAASAASGFMAGSEYPTWQAVDANNNLTCK